MGTVTTRMYGNGPETVAGSDLDAVSDLLEHKGAVVWVDLDDPTPAQLEALAHELGLHHLAVEDAIERHQRDKYVHYDDHLFLVCHVVELDVERSELRMTEIDAFIGDRWLVTVHTGQRDLFDRAVTRWDRSRELVDCGVGFLVYGLLDVVVDGYFDVVEAFDLYYDEKADRVFGEDPIEPSEQRRWFEMRRSLNQFKHIVAPLADALESMAARDLDRFAEPAAPYLRDVANEIVRVRSEVEGLRELVGQIVDVNLTLRDFRQNMVMKKVTSWAAIFAVPTVTTGFYGMNVPYPGSGETWGVVTASAVSIGASFALYVVFKRRGWL